MPNPGGISQGAPPDPNRRRKNADPFPHVKVSQDDELRGPELPEGMLPGGDPWHRMTREWWETWRRSPQAQQMGDTDWAQLLETAVLHHWLWETGDPKYAAEVRQRVSKHGATREDRLRLRMDIVGPNDKPAEEKPEQSGAKGRRQKLHIAG